MNVIGLDLGTTTLSAVVVDSDTGKVMETVNVPNGANRTPRDSFERIQDPDVIAEKALKIVEGLKKKYRISAIGMDGQMHGILYADNAGHAVSPLFTWQDQRGEEKFNGTTYTAELARRSGYPVASGYGMVTHFWHVINSLVPESAKKICTIYDYTGMRLTGRTEPLMHVSTAASLGLMDPDRDQWDTAAALRSGIQPDMLPEVTNQFALLGYDGDGIPVACGLGDNQASFIGSMREMEGGLLVNIGTGGQVSMLSDHPVAVNGLEMRPLGDRKALLVGSSLCGGRAYALLESFVRSCARLAGTGDEPLFEAMNRAGLKMMDDPSLLCVDTRFNGTRIQPEIRGSISGIGTDNFDADHLIAGLLLGMAHELYEMYQQMLDSGAAAARFLIGSGNGLRKNPALKRAFEKVFDLEMRIPAHTEEAAYGAALSAMTAAGFMPSLKEAQALIDYP